jgi:hypothetical protein
VNALADRDVGDYLNTYFVSSFQKVGAFRIAGGRKQGGNVACYFCTPDGRVLHAVAGPVRAGVLLLEARWAVETWKLATLERQDSGPALQAFFAKAHAEHLKWEHGITLPRPPCPGAAQPVADPAELLRQRPFRGLSPQARVHVVLANNPLVPIEQLYRLVFETILGEKISTNPIEVSQAP